MSGIQSLTVLIGRILLSGIFLMSGADKIMRWNQTVDQMEAEGVLWAPVLLVIATVLEIGGGLSVLLGWLPRLGAAALIVFLVPVTAIYHDFWQYEGEAQMQQMQHFTKNITIIGGLLVLLACGAGRYSISHRRAHRANRETQGRA
jgi:putative oxidoreductase